jgi:hypothetical protein
MDPALSLPPCTPAPLLLAPELPPEDEPVRPPESVPLDDDVGDVPLELPLEHAALARMRAVRVVPIELPNFMRAPSEGIGPGEITGPPKVQWEEVGKYVDLFYFVLSLGQRASQARALGRLQGLNNGRVFAYRWPKRGLVWNLGERVGGPASSSLCS